MVVVRPLFDPFLRLRDRMDDEVLTVGQLINETLYEDWTEEGGFENQT